MPAIHRVRVSTDDQNPDWQIQALKKAGCKTIYTDTVSGTVRKRPQLDRCLNALNSGDVLVVWKLDRLGRSLPHLVGILEDLKGRGVGLRSLTEAIDTDTPTGRLMGHIIGALTEFARSLIIERTRAGIKATKRGGMRAGRKPKLTAQQVVYARQLITKTTGVRVFKTASQVGGSHVQTRKAGPLCKSPDSTRTSCLFLFHNQYAPRQAPSAR